MKYDNKPAWDDVLSSAYLTGEVAIVQDILDEFKEDFESVLLDTNQTREGKI